jgi:16S rRNA (guanine527-N7)-methyltransferase
MDLAAIGALLRPFLAGAESSSSSAAFSLDRPAALSEFQLCQLSQYLDLLLFWNDKVNLTAIRDAEDMVPRHFGESLFLGRALFPADGDESGRLIDFGSGAGFPGVPIKIWAPALRLNLIESNQKKATFLREVIRALDLKEAEVFSRRAENFSWQAEVVTMRAVERFDSALPIATQLVAPAGRIALLIGQAQVRIAHEFAREIAWQPATPVPHSTNRVLLIGRKPE